MRTTTNTIAKEEKTSFTSTGCTEIDMLQYQPTEMIIEEDKGMVVSGEDLHHNIHIIQKPNRDIQIIYNYSKEQFQSFIDRFLDYSNTSGKSRETYKGALFGFLRWVVSNYGTLNNINKDTFIEYREHLTTSTTPQYSLATITLYFNVAKKFMNFLKDEDLYPDIKVSSIKTPKMGRTLFKKQPLSPQKSSELLKVVKEHSIRDYSLILLLITTGMRTVEVERAVIGDLSVIEGTPVLYIQGKGHSEKDTYVKLTNETKRALNEYLSTRTDGNVPTAPLFKGQKHIHRITPMTTRNMRLLVKFYFRMIGIDDKRYTTHSLRHTAATTAIKSGADLREVQQFIRHKNITTTQIYLHEQETINNRCSNLIESAIFGA